MPGTATRPPPPRNACNPMCHAISISKAALSRASNRAHLPRKKPRTWNVGRHASIAKRPELEPMATSATENRVVFNLARNTRASRSIERNTTTILADEPASTKRDRPLPAGRAAVCYTFYSKGSDEILAQRYPLHRGPKFTVSGKALLQHHRPS